MSKFRKLLDRMAGEREIEFLIPHPFLPPRLQEVAERRNMILLFDRDFTLHVRWEGARRGEWHSITPGEARQIIASARRLLTRYRTELLAFEGFIRATAEQPFDHPRFDPPSDLKKLPKPKIREEGTSDSVTVITAEISAAANQGGESPFPDMEY